MNKLFKTFSLLAAMAFLAAACAPLAVNAAEAAPVEANYQAMLGRPLHDQSVAEFITSNNCAQAGSFLLCQPAGLALWTDADRTVKTVYLYVSNAEGFAPYKGELPLGIAAADTMADVEEKFGQPKEIHAPQAGWMPGLPDEGGSPDHMHYWAVYERFGVTIVYNSPSANDKNASIQAILINE